VVNPPWREKRRRSRGKGEGERPFNNSSDGKKKSDGTIGVDFCG